MKNTFIRSVRILIFILACALPAGCGESRQNERIREKLILAYQYLESMEYDAALDSFAAVIEIDEKQTDAYIGMARACSLLGRQSEARERALAGFEATGSNALQSLERTYARIEDHEDDLKEIAALLGEGEEKIPSELGERESGLFSETLDRLWESLDQSDLYVYSEDVLIYPVDPEKGIFLMLYPDGHFYLGEAIFTPYSEILAMEDEAVQESDGAVPDHENHLIIPGREGAGIWAGIDTEGEMADFYAGLWKAGLPEDPEGFYVCQDLSSGSRFVFYGIVEKASLGTPSRLYGSADAFVDRVLGTEEGSRISVKDLFLSAVNPFGRGLEAVMIPAAHEEKLYDLDFENRDFFERFDRGEDPYRILLSLNRFHGVSITARDKKAYVTDAEGNTVFCGYEGWVGFEPIGFRAALILGDGEEYDPARFADEKWMDQVESGDRVWYFLFDWEGNAVYKESVMTIGPLPFVDETYGWVFESPTVYYGGVPRWERLYSFLPSDMPAGN